MKLYFSGTSSILVLLKLMELALDRNVRIPPLTAVVRNEGGELVRYTGFFPLGFGSFINAIRVSGECFDGPEDVSFFWSGDEPSQRAGGRSYLESVELLTEAGEVDSAGNVFPDGRLDRLFKEPVGKWRELPENAQFTYLVQA